MELFFDLAFVPVMAELAVELRAKLTLHGVLVFAGRRLGDRHRVTRL